MSQSKMCSRNDCPTTHISPETTINCAKCKHLVHLPCIGIFVKANQIESPNVKIYCNKCLNNVQQTPDKQTPRQQTPKNTKTSAVNQPSMFDSTANVKLDELLKLTRELSENLIGNNNSPSTDNNKAKSFATVLKEIEKNTGNVNKKIEELKTKSVQAPVTPIPSRMFREVFPNLESSRKRRRGDNAPSVIDSTPLLKFTPNAQKKPRKNTLNDETKNAVKNRNLITGTGKSTNHKLGDAVVVNKERKTQTKTKLTKSLYVTRFKTYIQTSDIVAHIDDKLPNTNANDFAVYMLLKKDKQISTLTYISFRICCTEELYNSMTNPDFWPDGILIGDFYESPKQVKFGDFLPGQQPEPKNHLLSPKQTTSTSSQVI